MPAPAAGRIGSHELLFAGHGGDELRGVLLLPDLAAGAGKPGGGAAVLALHGTPGVDAEALELGRELAGRGYVALLVDLWSRGAAEPAVLPHLPGPDRRTLADLEAALSVLGARDEVDERSVAALGLGAGGTLAFLLGCTSTRAAAIVDVAGSPLHPALSAAHPAQPIELVLNLDRPFLGVFGADDPSVPAVEVELLREALDSASKDFALEILPDAGPGFFRADRGHYHGPAREARERIWRFLEEVL